MKKSFLAIACAVALTACKKNETTTSEMSTDSLEMNMPADTAMIQDSMAVSGDTTQSGTLNDQDRTFAMEAAKSGMMEVMHGQLAATNGNNAKVKSFGEMMVRDHTKANDELKSLATAAGLTLPTTPDASQQRMHDDMKAKTGADFDRAFAEMMVSDHQKAVDLFKKHASQGSDAALKQFAEKTLPTLEQHLAQSKELREAVK